MAGLRQLPKLACADQLRRRSSLVAHMSPGRRDVTWSLRVACTDAFVPSYMQPASLEGPPIHANGDWRTLDGRTFRIQYDDEDLHPIMPGNPGNIYVGWHACPNVHRIRFDVVADGVFSIKWKCVARECLDCDEEPVKVHAELPFAKLVVWSQSKLTRKRADRIASRYFELDEFREPTVCTDEFDTRYEYEPLTYRAACARLRGDD